MTASNTTIWLAILIGGVGTYAIRGSFIALYGRLELPAGVENALRFVPAAVLAALVVPELAQVDGTPVAQAGLPPREAVVELITGDRVLAGLLAAVAAYVTEDVLATIVVGMGALLALGAL
ncbi:AzlD domain-containing protein [Halosegnis longus]|uniref:AzlD domain-containing protein n=1 Tax=Halosegnis longus TaxID=2216012 RepID=UPI00096A77CB|nr:AzlD domain-containing protein [Salella cibi]